MPSRKKELTLIEKYRKRRSKKLREQIIAEHMDFVRFIASRFLYRGEPLEDLVQVGVMGLMKAIERYEKSFKTEFTTYAAPTIIGEIKHYLRDESRAIKVPRKLQELNTTVKKYIVGATQKKKRSPTVKEIAKALKISEEEVLEAMEASQSYLPVSLDRPAYSSGYSSGTVAETLLSNLSKHADGERMENLVDVENIRRALKSLPSKEREVIQLRFFENLQQMEIAKKLKISQVHVSRMLSSGLGKIKRLLHREDKEDGYATSL